MGVIARLAKVVETNLNEIIIQSPVKALESTIKEMENIAWEARQAIACLKQEKQHLEEKYNFDQAEISKWETRAKLALKQGNEYLAREALIHKRLYTNPEETVITKSKINKLIDKINFLEKNLITLKKKLSEAKTTRLSIEKVIAQYRQV